ncbi:prephenate dehydrogenase [Roseovarius sp. Pro17]|uniref:prephenate dehydrogenase n=1 Tax=Roseovarius sp. Pro17 TaxID=3108175 RepID=UPI002D76E22A|nr:prephenate dehydrogenase [Roseovarius sp. Pro17]
MKFEISDTPRETLGIVGFGAFGKLIAQSLSGHFELFAYDPVSNLEDIAAELGVSLTSLTKVAQCDVVVIAAPVSSFEDVVTSVAAVCRPGALIVDVGSVKVQAAEIMERILPDHVDVVATHPLFGPQSARDGIRGLKIAVCPIRGGRHLPLAAFLRKHLGLHVIMTTPHDHDREAATVQGLTHLIAKVLLSMAPLPSRMTTRSFELLVDSISMVQNDAPEVFQAIEKANPYTEDVRRRFFNLAHELSVDLESRT